MDISFSKGDVVTLRGMIASVHPGTNEDPPTISVKIEGLYSPVYVRPEDLEFVHHTFVVGERVWIGDDETYGHVRALNGAVAWIECEESSSYKTVAVTAIERAPQARAVDEAEAV